MFALTDASVTRIDSERAGTQRGTARDDTLSGAGTATGQTDNDIFFFASGNAAGEFAL